MQALISVFLDDNDKIRCINAGKTRITFLLRQPLYYACVSSWGEPESVVRIVTRMAIFENALMLAKQDTLPPGVSTPADLECRLCRTAAQDVRATDQLRPKTTFER